MAEMEMILPGGRVVGGLPGRLDTFLVRNHDMVHLRTCARVSGVSVLAWDWAEGKSRDEVASARTNGLRFCRACDPLLHWPTDRTDGGE